MGLKSWLFIGKVYHKRFYPKVHTLNVRTYFIQFPLSRLPELKSLFFGVNRWNLLSFYAKDHGDRKGGDLQNWALSMLKKNGLDDEPDEIILQTFPRVLGFVFNPVSFWFCFKNGIRIATIIEVNNTFGGTHSYVLTSADEQTEKVFHVSPFNQVTGHYKFNFSLNEMSAKSVIQYFNGNHQMLIASIEGRAINWSDFNLFKTWVRNPLMTFMVVFYIHLHAGILFFKRVPFFGTLAKKEN